MTRDLVLLPSQPVTRDVNGKPMEFYPLTVGMATRLRDLAKPITLSMSVLFQDTKTDTAKNIEEFANVNEGMTSNKTIIQAASPEMARFRSEQRDKAFAALVDAITDPKNLLALTEIVMDSLRCDKPFVPAKFQEDLDMATMVELLKGVIAANTRVFGPLAGKVSEAMRGMTSPQPPPQASPASQTSERNERSSSENRPQPTLVRDQV